MNTLKSTIQGKTDLGIDARSDVVRSHWAWPLSMGILTTIIGVISFSSSLIMTLSTVVIFGVFTLVAGFATLV